MTEAERGQTAANCVPVYEEPDHKACLRNDYTYAYRVELTPGQVTLWHRHTEDTVYFAMAATRVQEELPDQDAIVTDVPCGAALSRPHREQTLVHRVTNASDGGFHMVGAEAHAPPPRSVAAPLENDADSIVFETDRFRVYRVSRTDADSAFDSDRYGLLVALAPASFIATSEKHVAERGDIFWLEPGRLAFPHGFDGYYAEWR